MVTERDCEPVGSQTSLKPSQALHPLEEGEPQLRPCVEREQLEDSVVAAAPHLPFEHV